MPPPGIDLAFYGGYRYTDIATILDLSLGAAKGRIREAIAKLRTWMQADG